MDIATRTEAGIRLPTSPGRTAPRADTHAWSAGETIRDESTSSGELWTIASGWAATVKILSDGRRQIIRLMVKGDVGPSANPAAPPCTIVALTPVQTAPLGTVDEIFGSSEASALNTRRWLRRMARREEAELLAHLVRLGRLSALERTAHIILELYARLDDADLVRGDRMPWPLTQQMLADLLGLSGVHVNRTLQHLRRADLIVSRGKELRIRDRAALADLCGYDEDSFSSQGSENRGAELPARRSMT